MWSNESVCSLFSQVFEPEQVKATHNSSTHVKGQEAAHLEWFGLRCFTLLFSSVNFMASRGGGHVFHSTPENALRRTRVFPVVLCITPSMQGRMSVWVSKFKEDLGRLGSYLTWKKLNELQMHFINLFRDRSTLDTCHTCMFRYSTFQANCCLLLHTALWFASYIKYTIYCELAVLAKSLKCTTLNL